MTLDNVSCAVVAGAAASFLERNEAIPVILFSWMDPAMTSREIKIIFDDSPWALAVPAVDMAVRKQDEGTIPSNIVLLEPRISSEGVLQDLKKVLYSNILEGM
jgi:hypothetical protein